MARGKVVYEQVSPKNWRAEVVGSNGKHVVGGHGWNSLHIAKNGLAAAAKIITKGRVEVTSLADKKRAAKKTKKRKR